MAYSYITEESSDSYDYTFYSDQTGRIYTVTFDPTLYSELEDKIPTLIQSGYGVVFYKKQAVEQPKGTIMRDPQVSETIQQIIHDFLASMDNQTFVIYQCENYKEALFDKWYDSANTDIHVVKGGVLLGVGSSRDLSYLGFIAEGSDSEKILKAYDELVAFSLEFM